MVDDRQDYARPHEKVKELLAGDGFEDNNYIETSRHTFTAPFVNSEETQYLVVEDHYTNGRPPLNLSGVIYTSREIVDKVETMKVTTCLNPLHTAMAIFGCLLGYDLISAEIADSDIRALVQKTGYIEAMPVVTDPESSILTSSLGLSSTSDYLIRSCPTLLSA